MKKSIKIVLLAVLSVFLVYLILPDQELKTAYADESGNGSTIAGVDVSGLDKEEIVTKLQEAINNWTSEPIYLNGEGEELLIDPDLLQYNIEETISQYESITDKSWFAFWESERIVHIPLTLTADESLKEQIAQVATWDLEKTYNQLITEASYLKDHDIEATISDLTSLENERLAFTIEEIPQRAYSVDNLISHLNNKVINPGEEFSFLQTIEEVSAATNNETLNFVGSLLYNIVLQTPYDILERHQQDEIPTNIEPGIEANINVAENKDLRFYNNTKQAALIKASREGTSLKLEIYSIKKEKDVSVRVDKEHISPRIIERFSNDLAIGQEKLVQEGSEGLRVIVYREISGDGEYKEEKISRDYYAPTNRIILKSSRQPETTNTSDSTTTETPVDNTIDIDLDGDGLPDVETEKPVEDDELQSGSYYDKGGNLITP